MKSRCIKTRITGKSHGLSLRYNNDLSYPIKNLGLFLFAFFATLFVSSSFTPVSNSSAEDVAAVINSSGYFINLTSGNAGLVSMELATTAAGSYGLAKDTINIKSNAPNGYDLYLSMDNRDADGNRLYKDANPGTTSNPNPYLSATSGTFSAPAVLDTNSWGYALANTTTGLPQAGANFNDVYNPAVPNESSVFAGVPLQGNEQLIQTITTPDATNGVDTDIYYGVKANTTLPSGSYKGTVTYTAVAKTNSSINEHTSVSPSVTTKLEGGEILTIATMLNVAAADAEDPGDPSNGIPAKKVSVTVGGQACPLTQGIIGAPTDPTTTDGLGNAQDGSLVITCVAPSMATGRYDVGIDVPKYDKFWVIVNGLQYKYSTTDQDAAIGEVTGGDATAADIMLGKTAYVGGTELTGTMPSYTVQYDDNKTATENTQDAGLTWSSDGSTLTIAEGYHTQQQVSAWTYTPVISGISQLASGKTRGYPSDTTYSNLTSRTFTDNTYVTGISYNNFYQPSNVSNYQFSGNSISFSTTAGFGVGFVTTLLEPGSLYRFSCTATASTGASCWISFYGWTSGALQNSSPNEFLSFSSGQFRWVQVPFQTKQVVIGLYGSPGTYTFTDVLVEKVEFINKNN